MLHSLEVSIETGAPPVTASTYVTTAVPRGTHVNFGRGSGGRLPWIYDVGATVSWRNSFGPSNLQVKFAVYKPLNQQRVLQVEEDYGSALYGQGLRYQAPRYAQLTVMLDF